MATKKSKSKTTRVIAQDDFLDVGAPFSADPMAGDSYFNPGDYEIEETVESGAAFWKFDMDKVLIGSFENPVIAREDNDDQWDKGDTIGFLLTLPNGHQTIAPANYSIQQALTNAKRGEIYRIEFIDKTSSAKGQFSRFRIQKMKKKTA